MTVAYREISWGGDRLTDYSRLQGTSRPVPHLPHWGGWRSEAVTTSSIPWSKVHGNSTLYFQARYDKENWLIIHSFSVFVLFIKKIILSIHVFFWKSGTTSLFTKSRILGIYLKSLFIRKKGIVRNFCSSFLI